MTAQGRSPHHCHDLPLSLLSQFFHRRTFGSASSFNFSLNRWIFFESSIFHLQFTTMSNGVQNEIYKQELPLEWGNRWFIVVHVTSGMRNLCWSRSNNSKLTLLWMLERLGLGNETLSLCILEEFLILEYGIVGGREQFNFKLPRL